MYTCTLLSVTTSSRGQRGQIDVTLHTSAANNSDDRAATLLKTLHLVSIC